VVVTVWVGRADTTPDTPQPRVQDPIVMTPREKVKGESVVHARQVAVVTGAGRMRGIGRACALRLASDGYFVVVHGRSDSPASMTETEREAGWLGAQSVADEVVSNGGGAVAIVGDLRDKAVIEAIAVASERSGDLATVVNNAGTPGEANTYAAHETPAELWSDTFRINVDTVYDMCRTLVPLLQSSQCENKSIINFSSTAGKRPLCSLWRVQRIEGGGGGLDNPTGT